MPLNLIIILLLVLLNGLFSMSEMAIVSARKNRLSERAEDGSAGAQRALQLSANPNRFLSTVQVGITLIGILSGAFGGATLAEPIAGWIARVPLLQPYAEGIAVVLVVMVITYLSLVIGELVPKRLALNNAETIAVSVAPLMHVVSLVTTPLVSLLSGSTDLLLRLLRVRPSSEPAVTEDDVRSMISQGTRIGIFEPSEQEMVSQVFRLGDRRVATVMTPRTEIVSINVEDPPDEISQAVANSRYSRFPVYEDTPDNVVGVVHVKDLYRGTATDHRVNLHTLLEQPLYVPESMTALEVLEAMKRTGSEMALVIDEYGGVLGLVSTNDILEAIVGDVTLPQAGETADVVRREDGSLLLDGRLLAEDLKEILDLDELPEEEKGYYETLAGLLLYGLGRIPQTGDTYEWAGYRLEVVDMDGRRIDKVLAVKTGEA